MHGVRNLLWFSLVAIALDGWAFGALASDSSSVPLASVRLYNPTAWDGSLPVEVPVGRLATPGLVDWSKVHLVAEGGGELPFCIREGRPHWKARLHAPIIAPRAEDLLVFSCAVKPQTWMRIDIVAGERRTPTAVTDRAGQLVVSYPNLQATIDVGTGMLVQLEAFGQRLLDDPVAISVSENLDDKGTKKPLQWPRVRLAAQASNGAMTELHFVLEAADRLALAVSYRIHACGMVEICCDERPWQGRSPWVDHAATVAFPLGGQSEVLPLLVNRAPLYAFHDYADVVKHAAAIHRYPLAAVLELGEQSTNCRRWNRRLYAIPSQQAGQVQDLVALADKGFIVEPLPKTVLLLGNTLFQGSPPSPPAPLPRAGEGSLEAVSKAIRIAYPKGNHVPAQVLADALKPKGVAATCVEARADAGNSGITLVLLAPQEASGVEGDGFEIRPQADGKGVRISACTRFGLMQAVLRAAGHLKNGGDGLSLPLVAGNPVVALRGGGFGGGDFEVDFPYGSEDDWCRAFDTLIASGMNVMADLGMWGNWKMPISYRYMPELRSDAPDAYDEVSGAKFSEIAAHRERGLRLLKYLHERGVKVWLWLPVGCVPTTYAQEHPEAMAPQSNKCPCFSHPLYARYLEAFLKELLETYAIDGIVMIRDDNGGLCTCDRCKAYVAASPTKSATWEQHLILYRWLKTAGFRGDIAVYPYFDFYQPRLDPLLPPDLQIVGHGSGAAMLTRDYEMLCPMGDTWLDNIFSGFRPPGAPRMRRLLADRNSFWIGGALCGSELTWESIGRFGWEPTATVSTLRYEQGTAQFGRERALAYVEVTDAYERLWEIYDLPMLPREWMKLDDARRGEVAADGRQSLDQFRQRLAALRRTSGDGAQDPWFRHLEVFGSYFEYHLRRLELFAQMHAIAVANKGSLAKPEGLQPALREQLLIAHREIYDLAERFDRQAATVPGNMMARVRANRFTRPFKEWVNGYDVSIESSLEVPQFAGTAEVASTEFKAGEPFVLRVRLENTGVCPWMPGLGHRLEIGGEAARLDLPKAWEYDGPWMAYGDRREVELRGSAPKEPGEAQCHLTFLGPMRGRHVVFEWDIKLRWK